MNNRVITPRSHFTVELIDAMGSDEMICKAARVSTMGSASMESAESAGLINFLMKNRHGTPFEHNALTFRIEAPIAVWREFMRHRIAFSYNEQSARYMEMLPNFYMPPEHRPLVQIGKPGHYEFIEGTPEQYASVLEQMTFAYQAAWLSYQKMLKEGVAKEVSRMVLPVGIYSSCYVTCNARSLMSFLSLRTKYKESMFPSFPQWEINMVADQMEVFFVEQFPLTATAFHKNGRVSP